MCYLLHIRLVDMHVAFRQELDHLKFTAQLYCTEYQKISSFFFSKPHLFCIAYLSRGDTAHHLASMCTHNLGKRTENAIDFVEATILSKCR